jgi:hypothetical protein
MPDLSLVVQVTHRMTLVGDLTGTRQAFMNRVTAGLGKLIVARACSQDAIMNGEEFFGL